jgi:hypothetical protein
MPFPIKKKAAALPPDDEEAEAPDSEVEEEIAPKKRAKGKIPPPGVGTPAWKKIAAAMATTKK